MNFNWPLSSFEPHIRGVRNLSRLSAHSTNDAFILFVSSVSAVGAWKGPGPAPEEPMDDMSVAAPMGYGRSKLVAECLLDEAARVSGVRSACCRVGIVAGPVGSRLGMWSKREYIPSVCGWDQAIAVNHELIWSLDNCLVRLPGSLPCVV